MREGGRERTDCTSHSLCLCIPALALSRSLDHSPPLLLSLLSFTLSFFRSSFLLHSRAFRLPREIRTKRNIFMQTRTHTQTHALFLPDALPRMPVRLTSCTALLASRIPFHPAILSLDHSIHQRQRPSPACILILLLQATERPDDADDDPPFSLIPSRDLIEGGADGATGKARKERNCLQERRASERASDD